MKVIPDALISDIQVLIDNAIHLRHTWSQVAAIKKALMELKDLAEEEEKTHEVKQMREANEPANPARPVLDGIRMSRVEESE